MDSTPHHPASDNAPSSPGRPPTPRPDETTASLTDANDTAQTASVDAFAHPHHPPHPAASTSPTGPTTARTAGADGADAPLHIRGYRLERELGRGGMGTVWLARDQLLDRLVTIKTLRADTDDAVDRLLAGARAAARVEHPGLVRILAADVEGGIPYLVQEYVAGESLAGVLKRRGPLTTDQAVAVLRPVAEAVGALHRHDLVHRDIKPGNILLETTGRVLVTDFGLSCERPYASLHGTDESVAGTPAYMAPEMFSGAVSARTDAYALGVTLFELLAGLPPYTGSVWSLRDAHAAGEIPFDKIKDLPEAMHAVIACAMSTHALYRYKTADHFARALPTPGRTNSATIVTALLMCDGDVPVVGTHRDTPGSSTMERLLSDKQERAAASPRGPSPADQLEPVGPSVAAEELVGVALPCLCCGYAVEGMPRRGRCPECGTAIWTTVGDPTTRHLALCDRAWLVRLRKKMMLMEIGFFAAVIVPPTEFAFAAKTATGESTGVGAIMMLSYAILVAAPWALLFPAALALKTPDAPGGVALASRRCGHTMCLCVVLMVLTPLTAVPCMVLAPPVAGTVWLPAIMLNILILASAVILAVCMHTLRRKVESRSSHRHRLAGIAVARWVGASVLAAVVVAVLAKRAASSTDIMSAVSAVTSLIAWPAIVLGTWNAGRARVILRNLTIGPRRSKRSRLARLLGIGASRSKRT